MSDRASSKSSAGRRSFLARMGAGIGTVGAVAAGGAAVEAQTPSPAGGRRFQPTAHTQDDWLDQLRGGHRFVFDTVTPNGFSTALLYANNFYLASQSGYGLGDADAAVVIIARHMSTPLGYNEAMWTKYGMRFTALTGPLPTGGTPLDTLIKRGAHIAVCQMATRYFAGQVAQATNGNADAVYQELTSNLVGNAHLVAAGILAVNRAQERGYTLASVV